MRAGGKYPWLLGRAAELGAIEARIIPAAAVVTAEWVRLKCLYGCGMSRRKLTCPPHSPTAEETRRTLTLYRRALLLQARACPEIRRIVPVLERELFLAGYYKTFALAAGPCGLCRSCAAACRHPDKARPSMEACGIDVFSTVRRNGFRIEVLKARDGEVDAFGLVLIE